MAERGPKGSQHESEAARQRRRGGFNKLLCRDVAREFLHELDAVADTSVPVPESLFDMYDRHPYCSLSDPEKRWDKPYHLLPYVELMEDLKRTRRRLLLSAPPQHNKTTTGLMLMAYQLLVWPARRHYFVSYSSDRTKKACEVFCNDVLRPLGIPFTQSGGIVRSMRSTVTFASLSQGITGNTCDGLMLLDDLVKNAAEARSPTWRDRLWSAFNRDITSREWGDSMSIVVVMTRWDADDLVGRLMREEDKETRAKKWTSLNFKAICESTEEDPLHREVGQYLLDGQRRKVDEARERSERDFYSMYMGEPTVPGLRLFEEPQTYTGAELLAAGPMISVYGIDSAYAAKRGSDWSVAVHGLYSKQQKKLYVRRVIRQQSSIANFGKDLARMQLVRPGSTLWFVGGQEQYTSAEILKQKGVKRLDCRVARGQLKVRISPYAERWNQGRILLPAEQDEPMQQFIDEVTHFTGDDKMHDDCVAALQGLGSLCFDAFGLPESPFQLEKEGTRNVLKQGKSSRKSDNVKDYTSKLDSRIAGGARGQVF